MPAPTNWGRTVIPKQQYSGSKDLRNAMASFLQQYSSQATPMSMGGGQQQPLQVPDYSVMIRKAKMTPVASTVKR